MSDTRPHERGVRRRRRCEHCNRTFETYERIVVEDQLVEKRDGRTERFSRTKLRKGIEKAGAVYALAPADVDVFVERVINRLHAPAPGVPIPASTIARTVMQQLHDGRPTTDVARIRYAIVSLGQTTRSAGFRYLSGFLEWLEDEYGPRPPAAQAGTPVVVKKSGQSEPFELGKVRDSVELAAKGRGTDDTVRKLAADVAADTEREIRVHGVVTSSHIATEVLKSLFRRDPLAYLRYASAAKEYRSAADFWTDALALEAVGRGADAHPSSVGGARQQSGPPAT
ncbi:MAG TPA: ATP cone domain-containing protein [Streptosporangiales bacterium]